MGVKSQGRGAAATLGLFLLFAGLVGGGVLYFVAQRRPAQSVEGFARAPVGCTTTLEFTEGGTFYVFEEVGAARDAVGGGCQPVADPSATFEVRFSGDVTPNSVLGDESISYDLDGFDGRSVQRIDITEPGQYTVEVVGDDLTVVAALGRDPDDGVDQLRRTALTLAVVGIALGLLLLVLAGRRSKRAAVAVTPDGPGWGPATPTSPDDTDASWPPKVPRLDQVPINPHLPLEQAASTAAPSVGTPSGPPAAWQPPSGEASDELPPPPSTPPPGVSSPDLPPEPALPDAQGKPSGT